MFINRRRFSQLILSAYFSGVGSLLGSSARATGNKRNAIDIHCHFFNAHDLPVKGFLRNVVIPHAIEHSELSSRKKKVLARLLFAISKFIDKLAPDAGEELELIRKIANGNASKPNRQQIINGDKRVVVELLNKLDNLRVDKEMRKLSYFNRVGARWFGNIFIRNVKIELNPGLRLESILNSSHQEDALSAISNSELGDQIYGRGNKKEFATKLRWAAILTRKRFQIADEYERATKGRVQLATPAIVDYDLWLKDEPLTSIPDQVDLWEKITSKRDVAPVRSGLKYHGYVGFDPLREAIFRIDRNVGKFSSLQLVQKAVQEKGFIGAKVYPPMGFLPYGNSSLENKDFPKHVVDLVRGAKVGQMLDDVLDEFYSYCQTNNVPILTHGARSNGSAPNFAQRADPIGWSAVLDKYPMLSICIAHMGDFTLAMLPPAQVELEHGRRKPWPKDTWEWHFGNLIERHPESNVFCDLSYLKAPYWKPGTSRYKYIARLFKEYLETFPNIGQRILFGSDWAMIGSEIWFPDGGGTKDHVSDVETWLAAIGLSDNVDDIISGSAKKFLGLQKHDGVENNYHRLTRFHETHGLNTDWLEELVE